MILFWIGILLLLHAANSAAQVQNNCSIDISITAVGSGPFSRVPDPSFQQKKNLWLVTSGGYAVRLPISRLGLPPGEYGISLVEGKRPLATNAIVLSREGGIECRPFGHHSVTLLVHAAGPKLRQLDLIQNPRTSAKSAPRY